MCFIIDGPCSLACFTASGINGHTFSTQGSLNNESKTQILGECVHVGVHTSV